MKIGDFVTFVDPVGQERPALLTAIWGDPDGTPSVNVVYVNDDEDQKDSYGRKLERATSVVHQSSQPAHGMFWK